jgi:hypothetical protein
MLGGNAESRLPSRAQDVTWLPRRAASRNFPKLALRRRGSTPHSRLARVLGGGHRQVRLLEHGLPRAACLAELPASNLVCTTIPGDGAQPVPARRRYTPYSHGRQRT